MNKKIWYLDNIRFVLAFFVVAWHSANAYIGVENWPVLETNTSSVIYGIKTFFDAITMPLFFYISGYFALHSIKKRGSLSFIQSKVKTIFIPWVIVLLVIIPFIEMIGEISTHSLNIGYFDLWKWQIGRMLELDFGFITDGFYQRFMWFLSVLFAFQVIFAIIYQISQKWINKDLASLLSRNFNNKSTLSWMMKVAFLSLLPMLTVLLSILLFTDSPDPEAFFSVFNIIQFQASRLPIYIVYFILGILTYRNYWLGRGLFDNSKLWNTLFVTTGVIYLSLMNLFVSFLPNEVFGFLFVVFLNFFVISTLGFALSNAIKHWDKPLFGTGELPSHAFNIYIIHYIFVHILQLAFLSFFSLPLLVKFICVTLLGLGLSIVTSRFLMKPYPKLTIAFGTVSTLLLFVIV